MSNIFENNFLPYGKHSITEEDINSVNTVLRGSLITQGEKIIEFEEAIAKKVNSKFAVALNSATSALHLACLALDVKKDDIVWTSPISFVASANCGIYCGAKIDFVDINPKTGLIDIDSLKKKLLEAKNKKCLPKVLIPVHLAGSSCDMEMINALSKQYNFSVIEDASHAIGGKYQNEYVGNCKYSAITIFSFHPVKIITTGEGGLATTNNKKVADKIRTLRSHGVIKDKNKFIYESKGSWNYEQQELGFNYRMTDIQAALGLSQLLRLEKIVNERNMQLRYYYEILNNLPIEFLEIPIDVYSSVHLAVIKLKKISADYYLKVFEGMRSKNIGVQLHYKPIYKNPYYQKFDFSLDSFKGAENYESTAISIPLFPGLRKIDQLRVRNSLEDLL